MIKILAESEFDPIKLKNKIDFFNFIVFNRSKNI